MRPSSSSPNTVCVGACPSRRKSTMPSFWPPENGSPDACCGEPRLGIGQTTRSNPASSAPLHIAPFLAKSRLVKIVPHLIKKLPEEYLKFQSLVEPPLRGETPFYLREGTYFRWSIITNHSASSSTRMASPSTSQATTTWMGSATIIRYLSAQT